MRGTLNTIRGITHSNTITNPICVIYLYEFFKHKTSQRITIDIEYRRRCSTGSRNWREESSFSQTRGLEISLSSAFDILQPRTETEQIPTQRISVSGVAPRSILALSARHVCRCLRVCVCVCESNCSICNFCFSINMLFLYRCSQLSTTVDTPQTAESVGADAERKRAQSPSQIGWSAACGQQHHGG